jgi:RNA polymerase sigma factor (sigma-70 family)
VDEHFPVTSWALLAKAGEQCDEGARAREVFARRYYRPVREFLMALVRDSERVQDLSQEFFAKLSAPGGVLEHATPDKGRFHNFLKQALRNLVIDHYRRNRREALQTHPDQASAEGWDVLNLAEFPAAEAAFHHEWVKVTLAEALTLVRTRCLERGQKVHLDLFEKRYLSDLDFVPSWDELGARYGMDQKAARERADTVVRHFRFVLRRMLRNEISVPGGARVTEAKVDEEIKALLSPLRD